MIILGLGCNVGDRLANLRMALKYLADLKELKILQVSPVYESDALLPENAPENWNNPYLNAAVSCETKNTPHELLIKLKAIENQMGRAEHFHWSPRIIDIDILAWDGECINDEKLTIPHEGLLERPFALWPLADVAPDWKYCQPNTAATGKTAKELIRKFGSRFDGKALLNTKQIAHRIDTPLMMGVLNITPDSFSDGGKFTTLEKSLQQIQDLFYAGADIIDIGAESTRPVSAVTISADEEWQRLKPLLDAWPSLWANKNFYPQLSIDTRKPENAQKLLKYKVDFLNDVTGFVDSKMVDVALASDAKLIFMHNLGIPANPEVVLPQDCDVVKTVFNWGETQLEKLVKLGIKKERLVFDVGIGFGKDAEQSFALIKNISQFHRLGVPFLVGHSRKSFLNQFTHKPFSERDIETAALTGFLAKQKVDYLRVHNIEKNMRLLKLELAVLDCA